jgi:sugar phosphate isomerase/epimerase
MQLNNGFELTYCTNIHPADGWDSVFENIRRYGPELKRRISPDAPFGLGLRLSAAEAEELAPHAADFRRFLDEHGLYVALINGFPYGTFHGRPVKEEVFAPDWRDDGRVNYTLRLLEILRVLLPEGKEGGISTTPLSYKRWITPGDDGMWRTVTRNVLRVAEAMARVEQESGRYIHLDIEPEPDGLVETTTELVDFFKHRLAGAGNAGLIARHVCLCLDACHLAVQYEDPAQALRDLESAGVRVGRLQVSSALQVVLPPDSQERADLARRLGIFTDPVYLHQVVERSNEDHVRHYSDLPEALGQVQTASTGRWRIHFHVPLFTGEYGGLGSTQNELRKLFSLLVERRFTHHLEIETYTWSVLPSALKLDLVDSIEREYDWVLHELCGKPPSSTLSG